MTNRHNVQMAYEELRAIHKFLSFDVYIAFGSRTSHIEQHTNVSRRFKQDRWIRSCNRSGKLYKLICNCILFVEFQPTLFKGIHSSRMYSFIYHSRSTSWIMFVILPRISNYTRHSLRNNFFQLKKASGNWKTLFSIFIS